MVGARKIELGCGDNPQHTDDPDWIHADCRVLPHVEYVGDVSRRLTFKDNSFDAVLARSILEHISYLQLPYTLKEWFRVLAPNGTLELIVPQVDAVFKCYTQGTMTHDEFLGYLWGGQTYDYNFHLCGFTQETLTKSLTDAGFIGVRFTDPFKFHEPLNPMSWELRCVASK
jgi:predicted SAM-dependent methyltransferase